VSLKIIKPVAITDATIVSTNAVETVPPWSSTTTYALGTEARQGTRVYISRVANNVGNSPATSPTQWRDERADNRRLMFDDSVSTQTRASIDLTVVIKPGLVNAMAIFNLLGNTATLTVRNGVTGPVVYTASTGLDGAVITDWYQYFFEAFDPRREWTLTDLPPYSDAHITLTIAGGGQVGVGNLTVGTLYELGEVLAGVRLSADDYSLVQFDEFGDATLDKRKSSKRTTLSVLTPRAQLSKVAQILDDLRATPAAWIPSQRSSDSALIVFGIRSSWDITVEYATKFLVSIELKGLT
jgi:hypothetical protein